MRNRCETGDLFRAGPLTGPATLDPRPYRPLPCVDITPLRPEGGDPQMLTHSDLGRLAACTAWVPGRIAHGC